MAITVNKFLINNYKHHRATTVPDMVPVDFFVFLDSIIYLSTITPEIAMVCNYQGDKMVVSQPFKLVKIVIR